MVGVYIACVNILYACVSVDTYHMIIIVVPREMNCVVCYFVANILLRKIACESLTEGNNAFLSQVFQNLEIILHIRKFSNAI